MAVAVATVSALLTAGFLLSKAMINPKMVDGHQFSPRGKEWACWIAEEPCTDTRMTHDPQPDAGQNLYCPACKQAVDDPLVCGDCSAVICRRCGTPLERVDEMGIG